MFTRRARRNYRTAVFSAVIICLCILILALAWPESPTENTDDQPAGMNPDYRPEDIPEEFSEDVKDSNAGILLEPEENLSENEENSMNPDNTSYYLVKRTGEQIAVFFCDSRGNMVQLETTDILYEMLGPNDQKLFDQGIQVKNQEELGTLLQDFEG